MKRKFLTLLPGALLLTPLARANATISSERSRNATSADSQGLAADISEYEATAEGATTALTVSARAAQFISVKDFGAKGDGVTDDTAAIQAAIDCAIYKNAALDTSLGNVLIPAGTYKVSDTIHFGYGTTFTGVVVEGQGMRYRAASQFAGTALLATFNDRPVINFQGARNSVVRNLAIVGLNYDHVANNQLGSLIGPRGGIDDTIDSNWMDENIPLSSSSRYAPYCGIAIDAYAGAQPQIAYPKVKYPSFLGAAAQYNKNFSSNVLIEDVTIIGFVVGVVNQPCDADGNGDFTKLRRVQLSHCQYGVSVCNTQSRLFHVQDSTITHVHTALVTNKHGRQNGCSEILFEATELSNLIYWHQISNTAFSLAPRFEFCRGEVVYAIGGLNLGARTSSSTVYDNCYFGLDARRARGQPIWTLTNVAGMVSFDSCTFLQPVDAGPIHLQGDATGYRIVNCNLLIGTNATKSYEKQALNASCGLTFSWLRTNLAHFSAHNASTWDIDLGSLTSSARFGLRNAGPRHLLVPFYSKFVRSSSWGDAGVAVNLESASAEDKKKIRGSITVSGRDVTFTSGRTEEVLINRGGANGDIVFDDVTGIIFYVRSRTGSTVTMRAQTGYDSLGRLRAPITKTGNFWYQNCRAYSPLIFFQGDIDPATVTVNNVGEDDDRTFDEHGLAVGDFAAVWPAIDNWIGTSEKGNRITAINGEQGTFAFASKPRKHELKRRFPIFYRAEPANA
jgi:hypothetical protein